jgi:polysaccharide export outer membrane protein
MNPFQLIGSLVTRTTPSRVCLLLAAAPIIMALFTGCGTTSSNATFERAESGGGPAQPEEIVLREGDVVKIEFPGSPGLNVTEPIKRDGKISLLVGEVTAAGKTVDQLQKDLLELYGPQLVTKMLIVSLESSAFPIYVTGAVPRTGRMNLDRPTTALEAILEAGVDVSKANLKDVRLTRTVNGKPQVFRLNLDDALRGKPSAAPAFYVKPADIIYVPEKFQWF